MSSHLPTDDASPPHAASDLGYVTCSLPACVEAGSWQTCRLVYTAGFAGIDDTGSLKIVTRYATDSGTPQFDDPSGPHYTTASASNGARLLLRYDVKDNVRPYGKTLYIKVVQGYLRQGDTIEVVIGDTRHGSPGWRMQTFAETRHELRVLIDRYATYRYEQVPHSPTVQIVASEPYRLRAVGPSDAVEDAPITVRYRAEDRWGNTVGTPADQELPGRPPGVYQLDLEDPQTGLSTQTNPIQVHAADSQPALRKFWCDLHGQSQETVGTNSIDDYFRFGRDDAFLDGCAHQGNDFQITDAFWSTIQETTRRYYEPEKYVTFPGWEWSGNTGLGGDRNVLYRDEGGPLHRSSRALVEIDEAREPCCETVESLFERLEQSGHDVMLVPHVGGRYADLQRHSPELESVVEVHSAWGTFEWMLDDAFRNGYRVGIVANSDGHKGRPGASHPGASTFGSYGGLTCVLAERLDRPHVWNAYRQRRVYATTGARILLDVTARIGDQRLQMGEVHAVDASADVLLEVACHGTGAIERVEIRNAMEVLETFRPTGAAEAAGDRFKLLWQGAEVRGRGRQVCWDGELKLSGNSIRTFQEINFLNAEKTCRQHSPEHLQWQSLTTGGVAGLILTLDRPGAGTLHVETAPVNFEADLSRVPREGVWYDAGGLAKRLSLIPLPAEDDAPARRTLQFRMPLPPTALHDGDNPLYIHLVQEDGHMAWSSPIYLRREA